MPRRSVLIAGACAILVVLVFLWRLDSFSFGNATLSEHRFHAAGADLVGTLARPDGAKNPPIAVIVHGDGPQDRWSQDGYTPLVRALLEAGIAVFSWDKPGIGASQGNWLDQTMADRAEESAAALALMRDQTGGAVGYLGFSQAGWVVPRATAYDPPPDFTILIGAAVNWRDQGAYYTRTQLEHAGLPAADVARRTADNLAQNDALFGANAPASGRRDDMSAARFRFVRRAYLSDARADIAQMRGPVLALWGADDLNVDPQRNADLYTSLLPDPDRMSAHVIPRASHSLLRARFFNTQLSSDWNAATRLAFLLAGPYSYAPGVLPRLTGWILEQQRYSGEQR